MHNSRVPLEDKSDERANKFREIGNANFELRKYMEALIEYNKSIAYACTKKVRSLGYANRSAVYIELEYFDECLKNIKWARENDYPKDKLSKLNEREQKCKTFILEGRKNIAEDPWNFFKLSYPANKKIPWIVDCLEVRTTKKYGRGIYATKNLKPGDILCVEEPVVHLFETDIAFYYHCSNCFKTSMLNLIPCNQTASCMFCSTDCMENFYSKTVDMDLALIFDMKLLSEIAAPFEGYEELDEFINKTDLKDLKKTIFDYDLSNPDEPEYRKKLMTCLLSLQQKEQHQFNEDSLSIYKFVSKKTANYILGIYPYNCYLTNYREGKTGMPIIDATSISLFQSLINHSCLNNIQFVSIDNKIVTYAEKPIKAGDQLFHCYYDKHSIQYLTNKHRMMQHFNFMCDCQECVDIHFQFILPRFYLSRSFINRKDFVKAKEILKNCMDRLEQDTDYRRICIRGDCHHMFQVMTAIAYYATFPY